MKITVKNEREFTLSVHDTNQDKNVSLEVKAHPFMNFELTTANKFTVQNDKGNIFGMEIVSSGYDVQELEKVLRFSPYRATEQDVNQGANTLYFLNIMKNKLDTQAKRGAIVKALAIGSRFKVVESFKAVVNTLLDQIFEIEDLQKSAEENLSNIKKLIQCYYESANSADLKEMIPNIDFVKRRVYQQFAKNLSADPSIYKTVEKTFNGVKHKICIPQLTNSDELATTSIKKFIMKFGEKTMLIYDSILSEKRILFSGGLEFSADEIQEYVFACASLISPPLSGILQKIHPYAALSNLDFIEETGYIAGVTNPMFKQRQNWHDICCEIDIGKLKVSKNKDFYNYEQEKYYNLDLDFIRTLI